MESENVAQDEYGKLAWRQDLKSGHERKGYRFGLLIAGLGPERYAHRILTERVGIRLEPHDLAEPGRRGRLNSDDVPRFRGASAGRTQHVEAPVGGDPVEPSAHRGAALESGESLPGCEQRVLERILGVVERAEHPIAVHLQFSPMRLGQRAERLAVSASRPFDQLGRYQLHACHLSPRSLSHFHRVSTSAEARTGRCVGAHFPDVTASTSPVAENTTKESPTWERS
jgi:hypothetical protein